MGRRPDWIAARKAIPERTKAEAWEQADGRCQQCGITCDGYESADYHHDHITPVALGGTNEIENIQILCFTCHAQKTADDLIRIAKADRQGQRSGRQRKDKKRGNWPKQQLQSAGFRKSEAQRSATRPIQKGRGA